jgi:hypothetical protein
LAAGGKIGGFSTPGGSAAKIRMLALEGFTSRQRHWHSNLRVLGRQCLLER